MPAGCGQRLTSLCEPIHNPLGLSDQGLKASGGCDRPRVIPPHEPVHSWHYKPHVFLVPSSRTLSSPHPLPMPRSLGLELPKQCFHGVSLYVNPLTLLSSSRERGELALSCRLELTGRGLRARHPTTQSSVPSETRVGAVSPECPGRC